MPGSEGGDDGGLGQGVFLGLGELVLVVPEVLGAVRVWVSKYTPFRLRVVLPMVMVKSPVSRMIGAVSSTHPVSPAATVMSTSSE